MAVALAAATRPSQLQRLPLAVDTARHAEHQRRTRLGRTQGQSVPQRVLTSRAEAACNHHARLGGERIKSPDATTCDVLPAQQALLAQPAASIAINQHRLGSGTVRINQLPVHLTHWFATGAVASTTLAV